MWFSIDMVGKVYNIICKILPFSYSIDIIRDVISGNFAILIPLLIVFFYTIVIFIVSSMIFKMKMFSDNN
jgi:uncharacterized phage infection (PIP) family protein YhgE